MWRSHSDDYGFHLRSDNLKTITLKEIRIIILNEQAHTLNYFVNVRNRRLRIDNGTGRSAKYTRQVGPSRNIWGEIHPMLWVGNCNRSFVVTDFAKSDQNRNNVSCGMDVILRNLSLCFFFSCFFFLDKVSPDCIQVLANNNRFFSEQSRY